MIDDPQILVTSVRLALAEERDSGVVHCAVERRVARLPHEAIAVLDALAGSAPGRPARHDWDEYDPEAAGRLLRHLLWRGSADGFPAMPEHRAGQLAAAFLEAFGPRATCCSNVRPRWSADRLIHRPMFQATFDAGLIVANDEWVGLLWIVDDY